MNIAVWIVATVLLLAGMAVGFYFLITTSTKTEVTNVLPIASNSVKVTVAPIISNDSRANFPNGDYPAAPSLPDTYQVNNSDTNNSNDSIEANPSAKLDDYIIQYINYDSLYRARHVWYHEQGFMAVQIQSGIQFYHLDASGKWIADNALVPNYSPTVGTTVNIVSGCFAPALGISNETYYLAISYGVDYQMQPNISSAFHSFGYRVTLFGCKAPTLDNPSSFTWTQLDREITHPFYDDQWNLSQPWIGAFGQKLQFTLDNTGIALKHCLYISGTQHDVSQPGGSVFMYVFRDNDSRNPSFYLSQMIKDYQLVRNQSDVSLQGVASTFPDPITMMYSFGCADFYVYTPIQDPNGFNFMLVGNASSEDPSHNGDFKNGYVQMYVFDATISRWVQGQTNLVLTSDKTFPSRLCAPQAVGFGMTIQYIPSRNVILVGDSTDNMPNTLLRLFLYQVTQRADKLTEPFVLSAFTPITTITAPVDKADNVLKGAAPFTVYPSNQSLASIFRSSVVPLYERSDGSTILLISGATSSTTYARALVTMVLGPNFKYTQLNKFYLGTFQSTPNFPTFSTIGYAQHLYVGYSRSQKTRFIIFNNPYQVSNTGGTLRSTPQIITLAAKVA